MYVFYVLLKPSTHHKNKNAYASIKKNNSAINSINVFPSVRVMKREMGKYVGVILPIK